MNHGGKMMVQPLSDDRLLLEAIHVKIALC
jgi:hypothetical protein